MDNTYEQMQMKCGKAKYPGHVQVLVESLFHLTKPLNMAMVGSFEVVLGQTPNPLYRIL
jgi:hypothetical protein